MKLEGPPIVAVECCCASCRDAATSMEALPGAPQITTSYGTTPLVLYRTDRVHILNGGDQLAGFRLDPESRSRRVLATCCNTPIFLDFEPGHWLSMYSSLWPDATRPTIEMRTMTEDMADKGQLSSDIPNPNKHTLSFFFRLLKAWAAMGFRVPKVAIPATVDLPPPDRVGVR